MLLRHGELAHRGAGRDRALDAELGQQLGRRLLHRAVVDERSPRWLAAEKDVLGDRPLGEEVELLVDDAHPPLLRLAGVAEADLFAVEEDRPRVGLIGADEDLHQGALAGAVLADDGMDLTGHDVEIDRIEDRHAEEALGDAAHLKQRHARLGAVGLACRGRAGAGA